MTTSDLPDDVRAELDRRGVDSDVVRAIAALTPHHPVSICSADRSGQLALSAAPDAYAAVYVHKHRLSIALEPAQARRLHDRHGWRLEPKTDATHYVHVNTDDLVRPGIAALVDDTLLQAFDRAFRGPRWNRSTSPAPQQQGGLCPTCGIYELSVAGTCPSCDE